MRVAILAGGGDLPLEAARAAIEAGHEVLCIALGDPPDPRFNEYGIATQKIAWGQVGTLFKVLRKHSIDRLVIVGSVDRRPGFSDIQLDWGAVQMLPRLTKILFGGGDSVVLDRIADLFTENGVELAGVHEIAPSLITHAGHLAGPRNVEPDHQDAVMARRTAWTAGALDMGQGGVAIGGRVVAMEGAEGTDAMLSRVDALRKNNKITTLGRAGFLAKCPRPSQDLRLDMPTIGPATIENAARASLIGVLVEAGAVLISDKRQTFAKCDALGIALVGSERRDFLPEGFSDAAWKLQNGAGARR